MNNRFIVRNASEARTAIQQMFNDAHKTFGGLNQVIDKSFEAAGKRVIELTEPITPMDTGDLRRTLRYNVGLKDGQPTLFVTVGGMGVDYAFTVHEDLYPNAPYTHWTTPGTGPKFLSRGGEAAAPELLDILIKSLKAEMQSKK